MKKIEEIINPDEITKSKYFNYYEVTIGYYPCELHLGEWMWTDNDDVFFEHFEECILRPSLVEIANKIDDELELPNIEVVEMIEYLKTIDEKCNIINYDRIIEYRLKLIKRLGNFSETKNLVEEIVTRLNVLGVDIQVSLFDNIKDALDLVAEHTGECIDLDFYDYDDDELVEIFTEDISM